MSKKNTKTCIVCGKTYEFCNSCKQYDMLPRWMNIVHNENCKKLLYIASDYNNGKIDKEQAMNAFKDCDLSYKNDLHKSILNAINAVMEKKNHKKAKEIVIEEVVEEINEETIEENIEE